MKIISLTLAVLLVIFPAIYVKAESPIDKLIKEPASMLDIGIYRLQNDFFMGQEYDKSWFEREYKGIEFKLDIVLFWPSKQQIMIHRDINAKANLSSCTIAIETLRNDLLMFREPEVFIQKYFWHYKEELPTWLADLKSSIYLVGSIYDPNAAGDQPKFFNCESRLDEEVVRQTSENRLYK